MAGGLGKRMQSDLPKVLHKVGNCPMLVSVTHKAMKLNPKKVLIVVGKYRQIIEFTLRKYIDFSISLLFSFKAFLQSKNPAPVSSLNFLIFSIKTVISCNS